MVDISGPKLDQQVKDLHEWYALTRQKLMKSLSTPRAYNTHKLSPSEQVMRFISMTPQDYSALITKLNDKYRGLPNAYDLVNRDLSVFMRRMVVLMLGSGELSEEEFNQQYDAIQDDVSTPLRANWSQTDSYGGM